MQSLVACKLAAWLPASHTTHARVCVCAHPPPHTRSRVGTSAAPAGPRQGALNPLEVRTSAGLWLFGRGQQQRSHSGLGASSSATASDAQRASDSPTVRVRVRVRVVCPLRGAVSVSVRACVCLCATVHMLHRTALLPPWLHYTLHLTPTQFFRNSTGAADPGRQSGRVGGGSASHFGALGGGDEWQEKRNLFDAIANMRELYEAEAEAAEELQLQLLQP
jgi:hypothetical protein